VEEDERRNVWIARIDVDGRGSISLYAGKMKRCGSFYHSCHNFTEFKTHPRWSHSSCCLWHEITVKAENFITNAIFLIQFNTWKASVPVRTEQRVLVSVNHHDSASWLNTKTSSAVTWCLFSLDSNNNILASSIVFVQCRDHCPTQMELCTDGASRKTKFIMITEWAEANL
jgi:hypothetical protein